MARTTDTAQCAYELDSEGRVSPGSVVIFGSKMAALEYAVERGMKYVPWPHGKSLAEAIEAHRITPAQLNPAAPSTKPRPKRGPTGAGRNSVSAPVYDAGVPDGYPEQGAE